MILEIDVQAHQKMQAPLTPDSLYGFIAAGKAWACKIDGKVVALGGYVSPWPRRAIVWGLLGEDCRPAMPAMTKKVRAELAELEVAFDRIEAYTYRHHEAAHRWLKLLGFRHETTARKFHNGDDYSVYTRIK